MSIFSKILDKLGFGNKDSSPGAAGAPAAPTSPSSPSAPPPAAPATTAMPEPMAEVDVVAKLDGLASQNGQKLNWKTSIVDLLKLLGLDSSLESRKSLATELGCPTDKMGDSAQMNMWLHKTVLQKLAANGGNVPKDLL